MSGYNAEVAKYNAWVGSIFGNDPSFLMSPMGLGATSAVPGPIIMANNTTYNGKVHSIDGNFVNGPSYKTNDMNLLPNAAINSITNGQGEYLGGI